MICDDASPDRRSREHVGQIAQQAAAERELLYMRRESNDGFPATANGAFAAAAPADVVLLNSDTVVADGWLGGLREAAYVDPVIATATAGGLTLRSRADMEKRSTSPSGASRPGCCT